MKKPLRIVLILATVLLLMLIAAGMILPGYILIIAAVLLILLIAAGMILPSYLAHMTYEENFGHRLTSYEPMSWSIDDFDALQRERYTFPSGNGQLLTGYRYFHEGVEARGVVVIAHGFGGGGHRHYMNIADYFAANGYAVFGYDATGNDESEGEAVGGLPQGLIDLDHALRFVKAEADFAGLPILLWSHSWGGYSVGSVLALHPDVKAAVIVAGFNASIDMLECEGHNIAGIAIRVLLPALASHEKKLFGDYAGMSVLDGLAATDAKVMLLHSEDDDMVPVGISYNHFFAAYGDDPRFTFVHFDDRGHNYLFCDPARQAYVNAFNAKADAYVAAHGPLNDEDRAAYYNEHLDLHQLYPLDLELMAQMIALYDNSIK